ncbi:hypothetical protein [Klebsiella pneumoniae]|uniref:hypothetical protein n=1 Tax=Klebsiella pneumoniae TaxID=573 RepID=UPI0022B6166F|nr:hypothetical protein [Klebsiella pneumoniae]MCZ7391641.1 hypothetical protein [Klebsiella pneumoniae]
MQETFEILKEQLKALDQIAKNHRTEPELQFQITNAMIQIATVMADIAKKLLFE